MRLVPASAWKYGPTSKKGGGSRVSDSQASRSSMVASSVNVPNAAMTRDGFVSRQPLPAAAVAG